MQSYDSYNYSGVAWIGEIPSHWECLRLGMIGVFSSSGIDKKSNDHEVPVRMVNYTDLIKSRMYFPIQSAEKDYMRVTTPQSKLDEHRLLKGDMVFIPSSETEQDLGYSSLIDFDCEDIVYSYHILRYKNHKPIFHYFKKYFINHHLVLSQFSSQSKGTTRQIIGRDVFNNIRVVLPPISEQQKIVSFLDTKTSKIDELILKKQRKIELLTEYRTSLINKVVTKGLNPNVEMKDSGVEWIGEIPSHWEKIKLGHYTIIVRGGSPRPSGDPRYFNGDFIPWITVGDVTNSEGKFLVKTETFLTEEGMNNSRVLESETLVISNSGATLGVPKILKIKGCINDGSVGFPEINDKLKRDFLYYFFVSQTLLLRKQQSGYGQPNLNTEIISNIRLPLPPLSEQHEIVSYLDVQTEKIDSSIQLEKMKIKLLKEYRQSLISEVVTGKIKVF
jgi:type I restriction enzyme S subunit